MCCGHSALHSQWPPLLSSPWCRHFESSNILLNPASFGTLMSSLHCSLWEPLDQSLPQVLSLSRMHMRME